MTDRHHFHFSQQFDLITKLPAEAFPIRITYYDQSEIIVKSYDDIWDKNKCRLLHKTGSWKSISLSSNKE
jgi:hypothetical protein